MKAIKSLSLLLVLTLALSSTQAAITRVQSQTANTGATASNTNLNLVFGAAPTAGNIVVLAVAAGNVAGGCNVTGTNIEFYVENVMGSGGCPIFLVIGRVFASASATITVNPSSGGAIAIAGAEYSGSGLLRLDKVQWAVGSSTSAASGATATTTTANELWVGALGHRNTNGSTFSAPTNSFSIVGQTNTTINTSNNDRSVALVERIVSSTGTANAGATISVTGNWGAFVATFEETPSTTTNAPTRIPSIGN